MTKLEKIYDKLNPYVKLRDKYLLKYDTKKQLMLLSCFKWLEYHTCKHYDLSPGRLDGITIKKLKEVKNLEDFQYIIKECEKEGLLMLSLPLDQYSPECYPEKPNRLTYPKDYLIELAALVREQLDLKDSYVDAFKVLNKLGGECLYDQDIINDYTAKETKQGFKITIMRSKYNEVNQSKIFHEIGHALIHKGLFTTDWELRKDKKMDDLDRRRKGTYDAEEKEVKTFVTELVTPRNLFVSTLYNNLDGSLVDLKRIATLFGVSYSEAENRAVELGLIEA